VIATPISFDSIVAGCFDGIRRYGADPQVAIALLDAVAAGARPCADSDRLRVLEEQAGEIHEAFSASVKVESKRDRELVDCVFEKTRATLEKALHSAAAASGIA